MNTQLFYRHARGVTLTPQGQEYFGQIHNQLSELQLYSARLRDFSQHAVRIKLSTQSHNSGYNQN